jgi:hypothetical protein
VISTAVQGIFCRWHTPERAPEPSLSASQSCFFNARQFRAAYTTAPVTLVWMSHVRWTDWEQTENRLTACNSERPNGCIRKRRTTLTVKREKQNK